MRRHLQNTTALNFRSRLVPVGGDPAREEEAPQTPAQPRFSFRDRLTPYTPPAAPDASPAPPRVRLSRPDAAPVPAPEADPAPERPAPGPTRPQWETPEGSGPVGSGFDMFGAARREVGRRLTNAFTMSEERQARHDRDNLAGQERRTQRADRRANYRNADVYDRSMRAMREVQQQNLTAGFPLTEDLDATIARGRSDAQREQNRSHGLLNEARRIVRGEREGATLGPIYSGTAGALGRAFEVPAQVSDAVVAPVAGLFTGQAPSQTGAARFAEDWREGTRELLPTDPVRSEFQEFGQAAGEGIGSTVPFLVTAAATGGNPVALATMGAVQGGAETIRDAQDHDATGAQEYQALLAGYLGGVTEAAPFARLMRRVDAARKAHRQGRVNWSQVIRDTAEQSGEEGFQESIQTAIQNIAADQIGYDEGRPLAQDMAQAAAIGALTGGLMGGGGSAAGQALTPPDPTIDEITVPPSPGSDAAAILNAAPSGQPQEIPGGSIQLPDAFDTSLQVDIDPRTREALQDVTDLYKQQRALERSEAARARPILSWLRSEGVTPTDQNASDLRAILDTGALGIFRHGGKTLDDIGLSVSEHLPDLFPNGRPAVNELLNMIQQEEGNRAVGVQSDELREVNDLISLFEREGFDLGGDALANIDVIRRIQLRESLEPVQPDAAPEQNPQLPQGELETHQQQDRASDPVADLNARMDELQVQADQGSEAALEQLDALASQLESAGLNNAPIIDAPAILANENRPGYIAAEVRRQISQSEQSVEGADAIFQAIWNNEARTESEAALAQGIIYAAADQIEHEQGRFFEPDSALDELLLDQQGLGRPATRVSEDIRRLPEDDLFRLGLPLQQRMDRAQQAMDELTAGRPRTDLSLMEQGQLEYYERRQRYYSQLRNDQRRAVIIANSRPDARAGDLTYWDSQRREWTVWKVLPSQEQEGKWAVASIHANHILPDRVDLSLDNFIRYAPVREHYKFDTEEEAREALKDNGRNGFNPVGYAQSTGSPQAVFEPHEYEERLALGDPGMMADATALVRERFKAHEAGEDRDVWKYEPTNPAPGPHSFARNMAAQRGEDVSLIDLPDTTVADEIAAERRARARGEGKPEQKPVGSDGGLFDTDAHKQDELFHAVSEATPITRVDEIAGDVSAMLSDLDYVGNEEAGYLGELMQGYFSALGKTDPSIDPVDAYRRLLLSIIRDEPGARYGELAQFIGERGADNMMLMALGDAMALENNGADAETIEAKTGWFRNPLDGFWRHEISDAGATWRTDAAGAVPANYRTAKQFTVDGALERVLRHPDLYAAYPWLRDVRVIIQIDPKAPNGSEGYAQVLGNATKEGRGGRIEMDHAVRSPSTLIKVHARTMKDARSTLLHEIQHLIQYDEGFATGDGREFTQKNLTRASQQLQVTLDNLKASDAGMDALHSDFMSALWAEQKTRTPTPIYKSAFIEAIAAHGRHLEAGENEANVAFHTALRRSAGIRSAAIQYAIDQGHDPKEYTQLSAFDDAVADFFQSVQTFVEEHHAYADLRKKIMDGARAHWRNLPGHMSAFQSYQLSAGEIEARATGGRDPSQTGLEAIAHELNIAQENARDRSQHPFVRRSFTGTPQRTDGAMVRFADGSYAVIDNTAINPPGTVRALFQDGLKKRWYHLIKTKRKAWHGTPKKTAFTQFDTQYIGTGEGVQAFGWGLYYADGRHTSEYYRKGDQRIEDRDYKDHELQWTFLNDRNRTRNWKDRAFILKTIVGNAVREETHRNLTSQSLRKAASILISDRTGKPATEAAIDALIKRETNTVIRADHAMPRSSTKEDQYAVLRRLAHEARDALIHERKTNDLRRNRMRAANNALRDALTVGDPAVVRRAMRRVIRIDGQENAALFSALYVHLPTKAEKGRLYRVDLQNGPWLVWDDRVDSYSMAAVKEAMKKAGRLATDNQRQAWDWLERQSGGANGSALYHTLQMINGSDRAASLFLAGMGYRGIKFADGNTRDRKLRRTWNYVVFSGEDVTIREVHQQRRGSLTIPVEGVLSANSVVMRLGKAADKSTVIHEFGHIFLELERELSKESPAVAQRYAQTAAYLGFDPAGTIPTDAHEAFAESFETWTATGKAPTPGLAKAFQAFANWMREVYQSLRKMTRLTPELQATFESMFGAQNAAAEEKAGTGVFPSSSGDRGSRNRDVVQQKPILKDERVSRIRDIERRLAKLFGVTERERRMTSKRYLGVYYPKTGVIRRNKGVIEELETLAHEIGHAWQFRHDAAYQNWVGADGALVKTWAYPGARKGSEEIEGFAEFFRWFMTNPNYALGESREKFAQLERALEATMGKNIMAEVEAIRAEYELWLTAPDYDVASTRVVKTLRNPIEQISEDVRRSGAVGVVSQMANDTYRVIIDQQNPLGQLTDALQRAIEQNTKEQTGVNKPAEIRPSENPYILSRLALDSGAAGQMDIVHGVSEYRGTDGTGPSLADAVEVALGKNIMQSWNDADLQDFGVYLVSRRMEEEWQRFKDGKIPNRPDQLSLPAHEKIIADLEQSERGARYREAAQMIYEWNNNLLKKSYDAGLITKDTYQYLLAERTAYVPVMRERSDENVLQTVNGAATPSRRNKMKLITRFQGSNRAIINPLESMMARAYHVNAIIARNDAINAAWRLATRAGKRGGAFIERVPPKTLTADTVPFEKFKEGFKSENGIDLDHLFNDDVNIEDLNELNALLFKWVESPEGNEPILYAWRNGERHMLRLPDAEFGKTVFEAFAAIGTDQSNAIENLLSFPTAVQRLSITTEWAFLMANFVRDQFTSWILTEDATPIVTSVGGMVSEIRQDEWSKRYNRAGGLMGGANVGALRKGQIARDMKSMRKKGWFIRRFKSWTGVMQLSELSETGTRLGLFRNAFKRLKRDGMSDHDAMVQAAFQARDYIDFGRYGSRMNFARRLITFLNAMLQGTDKAVRVVFANKAVRRTLREAMTGEKTQYTVEEARQRRVGIKAFMKLMSTGFIGYLVHLLYSDEPEYQEFSAYLRATHWMVRINGQWVSVPKPFELGMISNIVERAMEARDFDDPTAWNRLLTDARYTMLPPNQAPIITVPMELWANRRSFDDAPIVSPSLERLPPQMQHDAFTSRLGLGVSYALSPISRMFGGEGVSPEKVDHALAGFGGSWMRNAQGLSNIIWGDASANTLADTPVLRRFFRDSSRGSRVRGDFYDYASELRGRFENARAGYREQVRRNDIERAVQHLQQLDPIERDYALLFTNGETADRRLHPLDRSRRAMAANRGLQDQLRRRAVRRLRTETLIASDLTQRQRGDLIGLLNNLSSYEARWALTTIGVGGYNDSQPQYDRTAILQQIRDISPAIYTELARRYRINRVTSEEASNTWWMRRQPLIQSDIEERIYQIEAQRTRQNMIPREPN